MEGIQTLQSGVTREEINKLPSTTGIYVFKKGKEKLYIGKSVNLKARLLSHVENAKADAKEAAIVYNSDTIECIIIDSEFKALLLESQLIRKYMPKYNARWRDDKSPLYIKISVKDEFPKITSTRKEFDKKSAYFGPFPAVRSVYEILREIRRVFPFCTQKNITKRPCFHSKIHLCNPCPNVITYETDPKQRSILKREYRKNIRKIILVLEGKTELVLTDLYKELKALAQEERYEEAVIVRNRIMHFERLLHRKLFSPDTVPAYNSSIESVQSLENLLKKYLPSLANLHRIECYDVSNLTQKDATASMVVLTDGLVNKKEYRRFKIKNPALQSDFEMIHEVLNRRFRQSWDKPDLIVVDGGKPQVRIALQSLGELDISIPLIGIAKHPDRLVIGHTDLITIKPTVHHLGFNLIRAIRDESHRFAKKYHVLLRDKKMMLQ